MAFRDLDPQVLVSDSPMRGRDMAEAAARGVTLVVNNRPDHEETGQWNSLDLEDAARAAGMDYVHIPISKEFSEDKVAALTEALLGAEGRVLIFCASGTRSTYLWALAQAKAGESPQALSRSASRAGYSLGPLMPFLKPREGGPSSS
jgi:uncharacterized protein (TIGR01244 family)